MTSVLQLNREAITSLIQAVTKACFWDSVDKEVRTIEESRQPNNDAVVSIR